MTPAIMFVGGVYGVRPDRNDKYDVTAGYFATPLRVKKAALSKHTQSEVNLSEILSDREQWDLGQRIKFGSKIIFLFINFYTYSTLLLWRLGTLDLSGNLALSGSAGLYCELHHNRLVT